MAENLESQSKFSLRRVNLLRDLINDTDQKKHLTGIDSQPLEGHIFTIIAKYDFLDLPKVFIL